MSYHEAYIVQKTKTDIKNSITTMLGDCAKQPTSTCCNCNTMPTGSNRNSKHKHSNIDCLYNNMYNHTTYIGFQETGVIQDRETTKF